MKHRAPQHDLPGAEEVFNLAWEQIEDPDRVAAELERHRAQQEEAAEIERQRQQRLL